MADKYKNKRAELHRKLLSGEISVEDYQKIDARIRMASDDGLEDEKDVIGESPHTSQK